ncbi:hypothetical protein [Streptomyces sp. NPDC056921]|uniref:hypothetical protein n=1 Tax=Streptomyces sp. NPDC056921 TaxID=3345966 RepID=UPI0036368111
MDDQRVLWERAARNLILQAVDRTGCGSGWYGHCRQVLTWFLSHWGVAPGLAEDLVDQAIGGRFESWTGPDAVLVDDVAEQLALTLRPAGGARSAAPLPDHLESSRGRKRRTAVAGGAGREVDAPEALIAVQAPVGPADREPVSRPVRESRARARRSPASGGTGRPPAAATTSASASAQKEHSSA